jgi:FkbM family methyltransferase
MKREKIDFLIHKDFKIFYSDLDSTLQSIDEIFINESYRWISEEKKPLILDVGANIGVSCLYFKSKFPDARIICFEPDPNAFELLCMNIEVNQLKDIEPIQAAISNDDGFANFYGQVDELHTDARGNSLVEIWGMQRDSSQKIVVKVLSLKKFLNERVSLLKLDVEGSEELILKDIKQLMDNIEAIFLEFHACDSMNNVNDLSRTLALLKEKHFILNVVPGEVGVFPKDVLAWASRHKPTLYHIQAIQRRLVIHDEKKRFTHGIESERC